MRKFKIGLKFDRKLLNQLKDTNNSGVEIHNCKHHLALHPSHLNDFSKSIKDVLNAGIAKYNKNLDGILLGYQNIKLPVDIGLINYDSCYIHLDLQADFFVFKPEMGKEMQGIVNRKSKDHVGVLVYNAFNVSLPKPQNDDDWLGSSVNMGDEVLFRITHINLSSVLPYIKGELISVISEVEKNHINEPSDSFVTSEENMQVPEVRKKLEFETTSVEDAKEKKKSKKKKKKLEKEKGVESSFEEYNLSDLFGDPDVSVQNIKSEVNSDEYLKKDKSKKRKRPITSDYVEENNEADIESSIREGILKIKKEKIMESDLHVEKESSICNLKSKKSKKRKHSSVELDSPDKKRKRKSA